MDPAQGQSGASVLAEIRRRTEAARERYSALSQEVVELGRRFQERVSERSTALLDLAKVELPELRREHVEKGLPEVRDALLGILARREIVESKMQEQVESCHQSVARSEATRAELDVAATELDERIGRKEEAAHRWLTEHPTFPDLSRRTVEAEGRLARNEERLEALQRESDHKRPAYEADEFFLYLWRRGFGTAEYRGRGLARRLDRWLAQRTDFLAQREGYEFLVRMPQLVQAELDLRREDFERSMTEVRALEARAEEEVELGPLRARRLELAQEREKLLERLADEQANLRAALSLHAKVHAQGNEHLEEALRHVVQFLEGAGLELLESRARSTPDPRDDRLVEQLRYLAQEIERSKRELDERTELRRGVEARAMALQELLLRAERAGFADPASSFLHTYVPSIELSRIENGEEELEPAWRKLQAAQRLRYGRRVERPEYMDDPAVLAASRVLSGAMTAVLGNAMQREIARGLGRRSSRSAPPPSATWRRLR